MMKKIWALVLTVAMLLTVATAFGAGGDVDGKLKDGKDGMLWDDTNEGTKDINILTFPKEIVLYNTTSAEVHHPVITYQYSIVGANVSDYTITDGDNDVGVVYKGVDDAATITESVTFSNADSENEVTKNGKIASKNLTVTITPSAFTHAGIYRYQITENDNATGRTAAGVSRGANYVNTRYLDVYVRRAVEGEGTGFVVYGYVLFEGANSSITHSSEAAAKKSQGFVATETSTGVYGTGDVDYYETYNLKVTKNIAGTLAETSHPFPFSVAYTATVTTDAVIEWAKGTNSTSEATIANSALTLGDATVTGYADSAIKLADDEYVTFYGIPAGTTSVVTEINDTYDIYRASRESITGGTSANPDPINLAANHVAESVYSITNVANETTVTSNSEKDTELMVKNEMEVVSPTGIVLRVAPYALMLGAGIFLLLIARKRKNNAEEA